jgi:hypothetical protein
VDALWSVVAAILHLGVAGAHKSNNGIFTIVYNINLKETLF